MRCRKCHGAHRAYMHFFRGKLEAIDAVALAVRNGDLCHPSAHTCVDCDRRAQMYDHRDYARPLDVVPVCRGHNIKRRYAKPTPMSEADVVSTMRRLRVRSTFRYEKTRSLPLLAEWPRLAEVLPGVDPAIFLKEAAA